MVLEARENSEKIGFPVVGEEVKDASNVIDYDIRAEQTKDISAEINANNQTTTGMATVIPGINAPKLLETTSIISKKEIGYLSANVTFYGEDITPGNTGYVWAQTISDEMGELHFTKYQGVGYSYLVIPADGYYQLDITRPMSIYQSGYNNIFYYSTDLESTKHGVIAHDDGDNPAITHQDSQHTSTVVAQLFKNEKINGYARLYGTTYQGSARNPTILVKFSRLGGL